LEALLLTCSRALRRLPGARVAAMDGARAAAMDGDRVAVIGAD